VRNPLALVIVLLGTGALLTACDGGARVAGKAPTYSSCLLSAVASGGELEAGDIRALCAEATGVGEPTYKYEESRLVPANEFTRCYDSEKKELETKGVAQAERLAKLTCKYPEAR
jgi:hypothetical protein